MSISLVPSVSWGGAVPGNTKLIHIEGTECVATSYLLMSKNKLPHPVLKKFCNHIITEAHSIPGNLLYI